MTTPARMQANEGCTSVQEGSKQLLPGIPDEVTLYHIVPKLPWKAFHILSSVSRAWLHGIQTRQVYDARVLFQSTETLVFVSFTGCDAPGGLISFRRKPMRKGRGVRIHAACTDLPPIPYHGGEWVFSEGYIYLLGGVKNSFGTGCSNKVFVFDVAGQRQWKECASMIEPRERFGCRIMHGKVYVFGGVSINQSAHKLPDNLNPSAFCGSEVYDPKEDRWSSIRPMTTLRFCHRVETVGDELFSHGGFFLDYNNNTYDAKFLEVYHPVKDEWRVVSHFGRDSRDYLFGAGGKLYSIDWSSIHVYAGENLWTHLHSFLFPRTSVGDSVMGEISYAIVFNGELLVRASWRVIGGYPEYRCGQFQSEGFGGESEDITWQKLPKIHTTSYPQSSNELIQL